MIQLYPSESRFLASHGWLQSRFSFSFAEYYDPNNMSFGPMRVLNDDTIQPNRGFGAHPHREMEIVTLVLSGQLQHADSTGHSEVLRFGEVQRMTAGTGVVHSEVNPSETEEVKLLQMWFEPGERGLPPSYEQESYDLEKLKNRLLPVASNGHEEERSVLIHQDMTIYLSKLDAGQTLSFSQAAGRRIFLFVMEGELTVNGDTKLQTRDSARITELTDLELRSEAGAFFMLIDLP